MISWLRLPSSPTKRSPSRDTASWFVIWAFFTLLQNVVSISMYFSWGDEDYLEDRCAGYTPESCTQQDLTKLLTELGGWPILLIGLLTFWLLLLAFGPRLQRLYQRWTHDEILGRTLGYGIAAAASLLIAVIVGRALESWFVSPALAIGQPTFERLYEQRHKLAWLLGAVITPLVLISVLQFWMLWTYGYRIINWIPLSLAGGMVVVLLAYLPSLLPPVNLAVPKILDISSALPLLSGLALIVMYSLCVGLIQVRLLHRYRQWPWDWLGISVIGALLTLPMQIPLLGMIVSPAYVLLMNHFLRSLPTVEGSEGKQAMA